mmetsp:Transcript_148478/g.458807  ORF Transcript_148478/g.458807 Transcript_148478/m.458807 type:complete len:451 (-) Transcript_148478:117-1469(-)
MAAASMTDGGGSRTVLMVLMADRGHFAFGLPLGDHLKQRGLNCELWTNACCESWVPKESPIKVMPQMGDGGNLGRCTSAYKRAATTGDTDADGSAYVVANFPRRLEEETGIAMPPEGPAAFAAEEAGKELFKKRLGDPDVAAVVWEACWGSWAAPLAKEAGVPSLGLSPTYLYQFRAFAGPITGFDGECRVRDQLKDRVDPEFAGHFALVLSQALAGGISPPDGFSRVGALLPVSDADVPPLSPDLAAWLAAPPSEDQHSVTLVALGSQSSISTLSEWAEADLLKGCLAASPRVLALTGSTVTDPELLCAQEAGQLRTEKWAPQFTILMHSSVRCFVSHCGANSSHEALAHGVPIVPLPFFDDQHYIAARLEELYGYAAAAAPGEPPYLPLRKAALRQGPAGAAVPLVAAAVRRAMAVPREVTERLRQEVRDEAGTETVVNMVMARAGLK